MILLTFILLASFIVRADTVLDPFSAYEIAIKNNAHIKLLKYNLEIRKNERNILISERKPAISLNSEIYYGFPYGESETMDIYIYLKGEMLLWDFGMLSNKIEANNIKIQIEEILFDKVKEELKIKIVDLFWKIKLAEKEAEIKREEMAVAYVRWEKALNEMKEGLTNRNEEAELEYIYRKKKYELAKIQERYNRYINELKYLIGLSLEDNVEIRIPPLEKSGGEFKPQIVLDKALKNNFYIRGGELLVDYYDYMINSEGYYPKLFTDFGTAYSSRPFGSRYKWFAGLRLEMPVYDGSRIESIKNIYITEKEKAKEILEDLRNSIKKMIKTYYFSWERIQACLEYADSFERHAQENLDLKRSQYELELAFDLGYATSYKSLSEKEKMECERDMNIFLMKIYLIMGEDTFKAFESKHEFIGEREVTF